MARTPAIAAGQSPDDAIHVARLKLALPDGRAILRDSSFSLPAHRSTLVSGASGSGKSTLFRAIAGLWPYGAGAIATPKNAHVMLLPQKPYIPNGSLREAVAYPSGDGVYTDDEIRAALSAARLGDFASRLDERDNWSMRLSGGEQQRLSIARALLAKPDWLFLDEATAALDEDTESALYRAIAEHLPKTTIVSIGHRSTLNAFHQRRVELTPDGAGMFTAAQSETVG